MRLILKSHIMITEIPQMYVNVFEQFLMIFICDPLQTHFIAANLLRQALTLTLSVTVLNGNSSIADVTLTLSVNGPLPFQILINNKKSSCVNARGIPPAAYLLLHLLSYPGEGGTPSLEGGTPSLARVPPKKTVAREAKKLTFVWH